MPGIEQKRIDLREFGDRHGASLVVRLMMACNDLTLSNEALGWFEEEPGPTTKHLRTGSRMYFLRLQLGHLTEGMKIIEDLRADPHLMAFARLCTRDAQEALDELTAYLPGGRQHDWFQKKVAMIRHNLTFHYHESGKWVDWALKDRASRADGRVGWIVRGDEFGLWRFAVADDTVDSIICRKIWEIPRQADVSAAADSIAESVWVVFKAFMDFSREFVWRYSSG